MTKFVRWALEDDTQIPPHLGQFYGENPTNVAPAGTSDEKREESAQLRSSGPYHVPETVSPAFQGALKGRTS